LNIASFAYIGGRRHTNLGLEDMSELIGNGEIDYDEFKSIVCNDLPSEDDVGETFCVFDRDESGYIGIEEISLMFSRFGQDLKSEYIEAVTEAADVDGDGTITFRGMFEVSWVCLCVCLVAQEQARSLRQCFQRGATSRC